MSEPFYVTTPIYYPTANPHIGSTYTTTYADTLCRYWQANGRPTFLLTGTDEHGEKMAEAASERGIEPQQFVDEMSGRYRDTWDTLGLRYDRFIRTTDDNHKRAAQHFMQALHDAGAIEFRDYTGLYCVGCERFLTERELVDGKCEQHQAKPEKRSEANYFFKMSEHLSWLADELEANPNRVQPARYRNEVLSLVRSGALDDLCITRPKSRLSWGVTAPWDENYVLYVWTDALVNYLTGIGYPDQPDWKERWTGAYHLTAKDILKPHAIFWPTMLHAAGLPLYRGLRVHGYWLGIGDQKISKSLGNLVDPLIMREKYGFSAFRYYLLREMSFGTDSTFSEEGVVRRVNDDLANDLGNLLNRSVSMLERYCNGVVPEGPRTSKLAPIAERVRAEVAEHMNMFSTQRALGSLWELVSAGNKFIESQAPWKLAKEPEQREALEHTLYESLETLRVIAVLLEPFLPETSPRIFESLGINAGEGPLDERAHWGGLPAGTRTQKIDPLFPRIEDT